MLRKKLKLSDPEDNKNTDLSNNPSSSSNQLEVSTRPTNEISHGSNTNLSKYFIAPTSAGAAVYNKMIDIQRKLNELLDSTDFVQDPIRYVYNPTVYAKEPFEKYLRMYCNKPKLIIFMGINPGPWGMCQTGVPFGEVKMVKNWLKIDGYVGQPNVMSTKRKIEGFKCTREEFSGKKWWNFYKNLCDTPQRFFNNCFVYNYCPIALMDENGDNITPQDMKVKKMNSLLSSLHEHCNAALQEVIKTLKPKIIIGIGRYAEKRALDVVKLLKQDITVIYMPHPSNRVPNNANWEEKAKKVISENNLTPYFQ